ncbi:discoidin domain-containing protein [Paenibacillus terrigena]|uniref:discoidin domain-containing protein n=1 Tax=Paenibacillus terrigena TaxID=369333 RepID=UPI0003760749|nr:discoidin domain-containing protein [Paenibacillus terrigena]
MKPSQRYRQWCSLLLSVILFFSIVFSVNPQVMFAEGAGGTDEIVQPAPEIPVPGTEPDLPTAPPPEDMPDAIVSPDMPNAQEIVSATAPSGARENYALHKQVRVSGNEVDYAHFPKNAVDGDLTSRWSSDKFDDQWFEVDLGEKKDVGQVIIRWQTPATSYRVLTSVYGDNWEDITLENDGIINCQGGTEVLNFPSREARYVKFVGVERKPVDGILYGYSFYEFEVYSEDPLAKIIKGIRGIEPISQGQTEFPFPSVPEGYQISIYGSDALPVIDKEGVIHPPLVDKQVHVMLQVQSVEDPTQKAITPSFEVTVTGLNQQIEGLNEEPKVIPSLQEWIGRTGQYTLSPSAKIVYNDQSLAKSAAIVQEDMKAITGLELQVTQGSPSSGDLYLSLNPSDKVLGQEGYILDIADYVSITAPTVKGVFSGTRSVLQILKQDEGHDQIPKGLSRDYPKYETRGFMIDVSRKFYTIDFLRDYVKMMAWYKMTDLQIHLNDDVGTPFPDNNQRAAFRLESELYPGLASSNGHYTKEEFRNLQRLGQDYGINIIPEIDTPGHSRVFTTYYKEKYNKDLGNDSHLDISKPETVEFVKNLFSEYIDGYNGGEPTFLGPDVQIGTDEYSGNTEDFRKYMDTMINFINSKGKHPILWGGMQAYAGKTPVSNQATMAIWHLPYGGPSQAIELGYDIINTNNSYLYLVPRLYADYLNASLLYNEWEPVKWYGETVPFGHPKLKGGMFALWNDISYEAGLSSDDTHVRLVPAIQVLSEKMWHGARSDVDYDTFVKTAAGMGDAPNTHLSYDVKVNNTEGSVLNYSFENNFNDASGNGYNARGNNVDFVKGKYGQGAHFNGGTSYLETPLNSLNFGWTVSMWINPDADNPDDAVLMESPAGTVKLKQHGTEGKLGFSKEGYDSAFNYKVPAGQWTHILLTGDSNGVSLYVNGNEYVENLAQPVHRIQTLVLPVAKIGSATNAFKGTIDNLQVYNRFVPLLDVNNYALHQATDASGMEAAWVPSSQAVDGNMNTRWASTYKADSWFTVDLGKTQNISKVVIGWETAAKKFKILASNDKETWFNVMNDDKILEFDGKLGTSTIKFDPKQARYVKFQGIERTPVDGAYYGYSIYEFEVYGDDLMVPYKALIDAAEKLIDMNKGNQELRNQLMKLLDRYPYHFETLVDTLRDLNDRLEKSFNETENPRPKPENPGPGSSTSGTVQPPAAKEGEATIKAGEAGTVSLGKQITVSVPAGAAKETTKLQLKKIDNSADMLKQQPNALSAVFELSKDVKGSFDKPIQISLTFDASKLGKDQQASVFQYDKATARWVELGGTVTGSAIQVETRDVGIFAVFAIDRKPSEPKPAFQDIAGHWAAKEIQAAVQRDMTNGYPDGTFRPDQSVTRAEFTVWLAKAMQLSDEGRTKAFTDQSSIPAWASEAVAQAVELGLIQGYADQRFMPNQPISRAEMVTMVARALKLSTNASARTSFADDKLIPAWAIGAIDTAVQQGWIQGRGSNQFAPSASTTRAESMTVLLKAFPVN